MRAAPDHWVGRAIPRFEDPALLRGRGRFTADLPARFRVRFVRSTVAAGRIVAPRVGVGGVEPVPRRIAAAEAALDGQAPGEAAFRAAADAAAAAIDPLEDHEVSAALRRDLVRACTRRALADSLA